MICAHCSNEMNPDERFCSKCGKDSLTGGTRVVYQAAPRDWDIHVKVLAWIFIISALFMAIPGLCLLLFPGMLAMGFVFPPFVLAGPFFLLMALIFISIPAVVAIAGIGLLKYQDWGRVLTLILSAFMLIGFPFGTAIGIYAFWVLLSTEGSRNYKRGPLHEGRGWRQVPGEG